MTTDKVEIEEDEAEVSTQSIEMYAGFILKHGIDLAKRSINLYGDISESAFVKLDKQLKVLEYSPSPITINLNSHGGCLITQFAIVDRIKLSPCEITVKAIGIIASAAVSILAVADKRIATASTSFMHHHLKASQGMSKIQDHEVDVSFSKALDARRFKLLATSTKKNFAFWNSSGKHTDFYFDAEEALEMGLIDEIETRKKFDDE